MASYRLKKQYKKGKTIVVAKGRAYMIDADFFNNYRNANELIQDNKEIGHFFEDMDGKPVTDAPKPVAKEEPKPEKATTKAKK